MSTSGKKRSTTSDTSDTRTTQSHGGVWSMRQKREPGNTAGSHATKAPTPRQLPTPRLPSAGPVFREMLAALDHEFSTPLAVVEGYTATLLAQRDRLAPAEQDEFLQMIQHAGRHLEKLTRQLLEIAQLEAGMIQLDYHLVDVSALVREAIAQTEYQVPEPLRSHMTFALHCRDALGQPIGDPPLVTGDVQRLRQLLGQLLENAVTYSPTGGRIDVIVQPAPASQARTRRFDEPEQVGGAADSTAADTATPFLEICVCDFGIGIPEEQLERIFDPFYRVDTHLTREQYGLGLGLTACKLLVALHHGRIWAESCPEGGSAFHVWLPRKGPIMAS